MVQVFIIIIHFHSAYKIHYNLSSVYQWNIPNKFPKNLMLCGPYFHTQFTLSLYLLWHVYSISTVDHSFANTLLSWFLTPYFPQILPSIWSFSISHHRGLLFFRLMLTTELPALSSMPLIYTLSLSDQSHWHGISYEIHVDRPNIQQMLNKCLILLMI